MMKEFKRMIYKIQNSMNTETDSSNIYDFNRKQKTSHLNIL